MSSIYQPRRPRASPLWQLVHHGWDDFLAQYESRHRKSLGPLRRQTISTVEAFLRCGDLASGFTRLQCPDCGHERLLAFTCKSRHFCPSCHQRRVRGTSEWIAQAVCHEVPHRQFVFTIPKVLRGIFRKRRQLLTHLFHTATETLRDSFRTSLDLPDGKLGAIAAVHTFGDYLIFHPHLHVLAADGLFAPDGTFHCMPAEDLAPVIDLFRHRFLHALREARLISPKKPAQLLAWMHSGFNIHAGAEQRVQPTDHAGRKRLAEYLLRHPFSFQKITWNATTKTVIYRSKRHYTSKRNFQIFSAPEFISPMLRFREGSFECLPFVARRAKKGCSSRSLSELGQAPPGTPGAYHTPSNTEKTSSRFMKTPFFPAKKFCSSMTSSLPEAPPPLRSNSSTNSEPTSSPCPSSSNSDFSTVERNSLLIQSIQA